MPAVLDRASSDASASPPPDLHWTGGWRALAFVLSPSSIWGLLSDFYHLMSIRAFALYLLLPATALLVALAAWDRLSGGRMLWRAVAWGAVAGLLAGVSYDVFRLPFVFARQWGIA